MFDNLFKSENVSASSPDYENMTEENESDESEEEEQEEERTVTLVADVDLSYEYTEHEGVASFENGETQTFTFDKMDEESDRFVLYNYDGFTISTAFGTKLKPKKTRKTVTIMKDNLNFFHTSNRTQMEETEHYHDEWEDVPIEDAMGKAHDSSKYHIKEDVEQESDE